MKYTYEDIIINPEDKRLEGAIGKEVYYNDLPFDVLQDANKNGEVGIFSEIDKAQDSGYPFSVNTGNNEVVFSCIIIKKEPTVKYVPFDLSKKEDRDFLRGKWVKKKDTEDEYQLTLFTHVGYLWLALANNGQDFYDYFTFLDGTPVGKKVEE